jgi:phospholipase C
MNIEHVVVFMLENNSFDRMLGAVSGVDGFDPSRVRTNPRVDGTPVPQAATVMRRMLCDPATPNSKRVDPAHDLSDVLEQLAGPNQGFVQSFQRHNPGCTPDCWAEVMKFYGLGSLPVLHELARNFAVCDRWFSSVPGPTWPNRFFVHSGTSLGHTDMPEGIFRPAIHLYNQDTVYDRLSAANKSWAIYFGDVPQTLVLTHMLECPWQFHKMDAFFKDCSGPEASFPNYAFIEPTYFGEGQNDQHPPSDVLRGEILLAQVYNAIRNNQPLWEKTLLVVLYDEHGGFFDHVSPPACVAPDSHINDGFDFARLGVRVPAILVSPWIEPQILHDDFDHTSLLKFVTELWGLGPLGARTAAANSFSSSSRIATAARTDTPDHIPEPDALPNVQTQTLNPNQVALVGFSRYLETKNAALAAKQSPAASRAMNIKIANRLVSSMEDDRHGETAVQRVDEFLSLARRAQPARPVPAASRTTANILKKSEKKRAANKRTVQKESKSPKSAAKQKGAAKSGRNPSSVKGRGKRDERPRHS